MSKQRVAIIGGGPAGLSAAFHLTREAGWEQRMEITVYQLGWRLGGKGATGRDPDRGWRIEEHGIHGFCNFYFNTWRMMRAAYEELAAKWPDDLRRLPTRTLDAAFRGSSSSYHVENFGGRWHCETIQAPRSDGRPWQDLRADLDWRDVLRGVVRQMLRRGRPAGTYDDTDLSDRSAGLADEKTPEVPADLARLLKATEQILQLLDAAIDRLFGKVLKSAEKLPGLGKVVEKLSSLPAKLIGAVDDLGEGPRKALHQLLARAQAEGRGELYRSLTMLDLYLALFTGLVQAQFWRRDFDLDDLDGTDFRDWLERHGASRTYTLASAFVFGVPNILFAYPGGDCHNAPTLSTASWLNWTLRSLIGVGEYFYFMAAGTGEAVVLPLYLLLRRRGVRFEFFHKLTGTTSRPEADGTLVLEALHFERQALTVTGAPYDPLVPVQGRDFLAWPNAPRWGELAHGEHNRTAGVDFEEWKADPPKGAAARTLARGAKDDGFDQVVWAIPPSMIAELGDQHMRATWAPVTANLTTSATQAVQLWLGEDCKHLGWRDGLIPASTGRYASAGFPNPLNAMVAFDDLLEFECWGAGGPRGLIYLCAQIPPPPQGSGRADDVRRVRRNLSAAVGAFGHFLVDARPDGVDDGSIRPEVLFDPAGRPTIEERLDFQYVRVNTRPTEAYVQAPPHNRKGRRYAWESGYRNLVVAGDWIYTGLNLGAFESAVSGGQLAAFALRGTSLAALDEVLGFDFLHPRARQAAADALTKGVIPRIA